MGRARPGPFQIKAAIAACQCQSPPDWPQIAALYSGLHAYEPTPVVRLNHAVAIAEAGNLTAALTNLEQLESKLADYQPYQAARAELLARNGQTASALAAYAKAIALAASPADATFLAVRRSRLLS
jgi:RNA polymerase sigma-70 factor (ECF subfamily)